ncbi:PEP-CTERM sorting domain-containing protein [Aerosakkonemataceae cyanobacterium BLCC-F50]|uniref:PEP-CTERM sorting domain-containing protein n=1 Tax=Floridaenema flaviceps BLCC-F50 TaxID=3153642 RepID=A0ABV4XY43_9CYAN
MADARVVRSTFFDLPDTGKWEPISISFTTNKSIQLTLEDFVASWGVAGDVYFDNIRLEAVVPTSKSVPEPSSIVGLLTAMIFSAALLGQKKLGSSKSTP